MDVGEFAEARRCSGRRSPPADETGDHRLRADASLGARRSSSSTPIPRPTGRSGPPAIASGAIPVFELLGDDAGLAKAWRVLGAVHAKALRYGAGGRGGRAGDRARPGGGRPPPGAPQRVLVRRRGRLRPHAGARSDRGVLADRSGGDRRPPHRGPRARRTRPSGGDARGVRPRAGALGPGPLDTRGARKQRARRLDIARGGSGRAPRREPGRGRAADPARRRGARADGRRLPAQHHDRASRAGGRRAGPRRRGGRAGGGGPAADGRRGRRVGRAARLRAFGPPRPRGDAAAGIAEARRAASLLDRADAPVARAEALLALAEACEAGGDRAEAAAARERAAASAGRRAIWSRRSGPGAGSSAFRELRPPAPVRRREDDDLDVLRLELRCGSTTHGSGEATPGDGAVRDEHAVVVHRDLVHLRLLRDLGLVEHESEAERMPGRERLLDRDRRDLAEARRGRRAASPGPEAFASDSDAGVPLSVAGTSPS